jgi:hypothetical protein
MIAEVLDDESSCEPHPGHGGNCLWFHPAEALASGTCPDSGLTIAEVEWDADELRAALASALAVPGTGTDHRKRVARGARGPKPRDFWPKVLGYAAGWLAEKGVPSGARTNAGELSTPRKRSSFRKSRAMYCEPWS